MARIVIDPQLQNLLAEGSGELVISYDEAPAMWTVFVHCPQGRYCARAAELGVALSTVVTDILPPADPVDVPDNPTDRQRIEIVAIGHGWQICESSDVGTRFQRDDADLMIDWKDDRVSYAALEHGGTFRELTARTVADRREIVLGVLVQTEHDPMARALAATQPLAGAEPVAAEPKSRAEQLADAADKLDDAAITTTARLAAALDIATPDADEVDQLVRTIKTAAEAAAMLRSRVDDAGRPACDPEQQVDPAVVVHLRSQLDQIREAASMAHASYAPSTSIYVLADEILTIARCPQ